MAPFRVTLIFGARTTRDVIRVLRVLDRKDAYWRGSAIAAPTTLQILTVLPFGTKIS